MSFIQEVEPWQTLAKRVIVTNILRRHGYRGTLHSTQRNNIVIQLDMAVWILHAASEGYPPTRAYPPALSLISSSRSMCSVFT